MIARVISKDKKNIFNQTVSHVIQSWEWGEFRQKTAVEVLRIGEFSNKNLIAGYQITFHQIPNTPFTIGYLPKSSIPQKETLEFLIKLGKEKKSLFIKLEPNVVKDEKRVNEILSSKYLTRSPRSIFATHTFLIDLTQSEEELMRKMHPKTRYNIRLSQRHGVKVMQKEDQKSFDFFLKLQRETARRQEFFIHPDSYYQKMWQTLKPQKMVHLLIAYYKKEPIAAWVLLRFKDTLYYPYGSSSEKHKEVMASNLVAWEAIRLGKKLGVKNFDFWGALGGDAKENDPWYGFHRFKEGYGGKLVEFLGAYDLVINPFFYKIFLITDNLRWLLLKRLKRLIS